jgi:hypothetical protein
MPLLKPPNFLSLTTEESMQHVLRSIVALEKELIDSVRHAMFTDFILEEREIVVIVYTLPQTLFEFCWILKV